MPVLPFTLFRYFVEDKADSSKPSETSTSQILRRVKNRSPEFSTLQNLDRDETRSASDLWNLVPNLLYCDTAERESDIVLCFERLFDRDNPPLQMVLNVLDIYRSLRRRWSRADLHVLVPVPHAPHHDISR